MLGSITIGGPYATGRMREAWRLEPSGRRSRRCADEVWTFDLDAKAPLPGIEYPMKREREVKRERDELDSLAAEAGQSAILVGMTALILVMALILSFAF
jgi:hypothetical protein